ncbi:fucolectin-like [Glandiceps talaboti]
MKLLILTFLVAIFTVPIYGRLCLKAKPATEPPPTQPPPPPPTTQPPPPPTTQPPPPPTTQPPPPPTTQPPPPPTTKPPPEILTTVIPTLAPCVYPVTLSNIAQGQSASQVSDKPRTDYTADKAVDGNADGNVKNGYCSMTGKEFEPWWKLDLGSSKDIYEIRIHNNMDAPYRLKTARIHVGDNSDHTKNPQCGYAILGKMTAENPVIIRCGCDVPMRGRHVSIQLTDKTRPLTLCEVEVMSG